MQASASATAGASNVPPDVNASVALADGPNATAASRSLMLLGAEPGPALRQPAIGTDPMSAIAALSTSLPVLQSQSGREGSLSQLPLGQLPAPKSRTDKLDTVSVSEIDALDNTQSSSSWILLDVKLITVLMK